MRLTLTDAELFLALAVLQADNAPWMVDSPLLRLAKPDLEVQLRAGRERAVLRGIVIEQPDGSIKLAAEAGVCAEADCRRGVESWPAAHPTNCAHAIGRARRPYPRPQPGVVCRRRKLLAGARFQSQWQCGDRVGRSGRDRRCGQRVIWLAVRVGLCAHPGSVSMQSGRHAGLPLQCTIHTRFS